MMLENCAPYVALPTLAAIIHVESAGNPLALYVNGIERQPTPVRNRDEAVAEAGHYVARGYSVDLGLMQVNSRNLATFGVTMTQMLDPYACTNIRIGATILAADYNRASMMYGPGQRALRAALSAYNTGSFYRGARYVARYTGSTLQTKPHPPVMFMAISPVASSILPVDSFTADTELPPAEWDAAVN